MITLRPYQTDAVNAIYGMWAAGHKNGLVVLPTGGGKTVVFGSVLASHRGGTAWALAHRKELVGQISCTLASFGIMHQIAAPKATFNWILEQHVEKFGRPFFSASAPYVVGGVHSLIRNPGKYRNLLNSARLWVQDEGHHILRKNTWGKVADFFPDACRGMGVTATPIRADGSGLGRHADGVFDDMWVGPTGRDLINQGYLCDYKIYAPPHGIDVASIKIGASGEFVQQAASKAVKTSKVIGDIVKCYQMYAPGKLGITFVHDVETATLVAANFNAAGIPAAALSANTPDRLRQETVAKFARRELLQLVNVDLFGEGFDLPAIEVVQMAAMTESYSKFCQQFGRCLRILAGKSCAIIIDHVGNVIRMATRFGLPDAPHHVWTLDRREKRSTGPSDTLPLKVCKSCTGVYEAFLLACPYCMYENPPVLRSAPEFVDGDLAELDPAVLAALRGEIEKVDAPASGIRARMQAAGAPGPAAAGAAAQHLKRQEAQADLRLAMSQWGGYNRSLGRSDREGWRRFYHKFGIDVMGAQAVGRPQAEALKGRIYDDFKRMGASLEYTAGRT